MVLTHLSASSLTCNSVLAHRVIRDTLHTNAENEDEHAGRQRGWYLRHCTWVKNGLCQGDDGADVESVDQAWLSADDNLKTRQSHVRRVG